MPKKILLADDSITIQKVVELTFSDGDYEVIATNNGNKAIQKLAEIRPDIILSDIIMPEKNGYELCEYVKSHPDFRDIPVILLTGTFEPFDPDRAEKAGCDAVITKPFESQSLIHKVEELIRNASSEAKTAPQAPLKEPKSAEEPPAFAPPPPEAETRAFSPPKLDDHWSSPSASSSSAAAPPPEPPPPPPPAGASSFQQSSFEEQGEELFGGSAPPPPSGFDQPASMPAQEETEIDYSGSTKAFPKMSFEDLQRMSAGGETAPEPMPPEPPWSPPEESAPTSEWASPEVPESGFGAPAGTDARAETSPFEESSAAPPPPSSESIFDSTGPGRSAAPTWPTSPPVFPPETPARTAESVPGSSQPVGELTDEQVDRIARRVVELLSDQVIRSIAWEVIPDLAEMVVRERIRQLENET